MIERSKPYLEDPDNVETWVNDGRTRKPLGDSSADFVFAYIVFQHIPDRAVITDYSSLSQNHESTDNEAGDDSDPSSEGHHFRPAWYVSFHTGHRSASYAFFENASNPGIVCYMRDAYRVLKPEGILRFQVPGLEDTDEAKDAEKVREKSTWVGSLFAPSEIGALVRDAGFVDVTFRTIEANFVLLWVTARKPAA